MEYSSTQAAIALGIYYEDFNFLMALSGVLVGAVFMVGMISLFIMGARK